MSRLLGTKDTGGSKHDVLTNGDQIFPAMLGAIEGRSATSASRPHHGRARSARSSQALERAARRGVMVSMVVDALARTAFLGGSSGSRPPASRSGRSGSPLSTHSKAELHPPQIPSSTAASVHRRRRRGRSLDRQRAGRRTLARHDGPSAKAAARWKERSTRTSSKRPVR